MEACLINQPVRSAVPTFEPVTLDEARKQLSLGDNTAHDELILRLIQAARETIELDTGIVAATGTYTAKLTEWPDDNYLEIRGIRPLTSITSIVYVATDGTSTTWSSANYSLDTYPVVPIVKLAYGSLWPTLRGDDNGITITMVAGYASQATIPAVFKQALLLLVSHWFENRGVVSIGTISPELGQTYEWLIGKLGRSTYP